MKNAPFFFLTILAPLFLAPRSEAQQFGPWKVGMTENEVRSVDSLGPYVVESPLPNADSSVERKFIISRPAIAINNTKLPVRVGFINGKVNQFMVRIGDAPTAAVAARMAQSAFEFLYQHYQLPKPGKIPDFEIEALAGSAVPYKIFPMAEFPNRYVMVLRSPNGFALNLTVLTDRATLAPLGSSVAGQTTTTRPTGPPMESPTRSDDDGPDALRELHIEKIGGETKFQLSQATVHALLVRDMEGGKNSAQAMPLTATSTLDRTDGKIGFKFNQPVGPDMRRALEEVVRAAQLRHQTLPANQEVRFGFADKWSGKDGPSAAVATALLIESLITGFQIPENVAVTGDLNANQKVQPVGGVPDKIRGALAADCQVIGIPLANEVDIDDMVVEEKLRSFLTARIFTLDSLEDAIKMVNPSARSAAYSEALTSFEAIQAELGKKGSAALFAPETITALKAVIEGAPNFYSAKILLAAAERRMPTRYSLSGTLMRIDQAMAPFAKTMKRIRDGEPITSFQMGRDNPLNEAQNRLRSLREQSDPRLVKVISTQELVMDRLQRLINSNAGSRTVFDSLLKDLGVAEDQAKAEWKRITEDQAIQDQLMARGITL